MRLFLGVSVFSLLVIGCGIDKADEHLCSNQVPDCPPNMYCNGTKCVAGTNNTNTTVDDADVNAENDTMPPEDAGVDAPEDTAVDVMQDAPLDLASDAVVDVAPDVVPDVEPDIPPDIEPDIEPDTEPPPCVDGDTCYSGDLSKIGPGRPCKTGTWVGCSDFDPVCQGEVLPQTETCNGVDDDCDGTIDGMVLDCYTGSADTRNVGECSDGTSTCTLGAWTTCTGDVTPTDEVCNGADDDCDGTPDDGLPPHTLYKDADGDGWGGAASTTCYSSRTGYVNVGGDCHDDNEFVNPGVTDYETAYYLDTNNNKSWDWDCSGVEEKDPSINKQGACGGAPPNCTTTFGYTGPPPDCGSTGAWLGSGACGELDGSCQELMAYAKKMACR